MKIEDSTLTRAKRLKGSSLIAAALVEAVGEIEILQMVSESLTNAWKSEYGLTAKLTVALERYGQHEPDCNKMMAWHDPDEPETFQACSCGLYDVIPDPHKPVEAGDNQ